MDETYWRQPYVSQRTPALADNVLSSSQPLASSAGLRILARGGNAVDAALATAMALTVVEPCMNGLGSDLFAIVWQEGALHGLNAAGRAPAAWETARFADKAKMDSAGWGSVTVPGVVSGWRALWDRFGSLPFEDLFEPAVRYARDGFLVSPVVHRAWASQVPVLTGQPGFAEAFAPRGRAPAIGERFRLPGQAESLHSIAQTKGESFYRGELAAAIARHSRDTGGLVTEADLAAHQPEWVRPISMSYGDCELHEIGPSTQGVAALMALGMLAHFNVRAAGLDSSLAVHLQVEALRLSFADLHEHVADPAHMKVSVADLLDPDYLRGRARLIDPARAGQPRYGEPHKGDTVYVTAADSSGTMISLIQSNFRGFGSGVVVPGRGISLHNRGAGFSTKPGHPNVVAPFKRPQHSIIPGFATRAGKPLMSFGIVGGTMQAQGHLQFMSRLVDFGQNPQAILDAPRWRVQDYDAGLAVEWNFPPEVAEGLVERGHTVAYAPRFDPGFGCGQMAMRLDDGFVAASDSRKHSAAVGL